MSLYHALLLGRPQLMYLLSYTSGSVQLLSPVAQLRPHGLYHTGFPAHHKLLELAQTMSIKLVMSPNHLILCHPLLLLPSIFPSELVLRIRRPKYWSVSFSISPFNDYSGLISFRMDWLDLLSVQRTLKSLLHHHSSKTSILWISAFFVVPLSHPQMTTGKTIALTRWTFVGNVMSLLFHLLSMLVIVFIPRSKHLISSWLQSPSAVILEIKKKKIK